MMRHIALLVFLAVGLAGCGQSQAVREERAVNAVLKLGGDMTRDEELPGRPVVIVRLHGPKVTNASLKDLKELKGLQLLDLGHTQITDAGLKDLKELKHLQQLDLNGTKVTGAALNEMRRAFPHTDILGPC